MFKCRAGHVFSQRPSPLPARIAGLRLASLAVCVLFASPARAQPPAPSVGDTADRPGFADSPVLLGRGQLQAESGLMWDREGLGAALAKTWTVPQLLFRAGLAPRVEISLGWDGLVSTSATNQDTRSTGSADVRLGAKIGLANGSRGAAALIVSAGLPTGSTSVSSGYADPVLRFAWAIPISDRWGLSGTWDMGAEREVGDRVRPKPAASLAVGASLGDALGSFAGIVAESPPVGSTPDVWSIEGGFVRSVGERAQVDVWLSHRLAGGADNWSVGAGFVRRLR